MKILVPVDGSKYSDEALKIAADYAKTKGADICLICVAPYIESVDLEISASEREKVKLAEEKRANSIMKKASDILVAEGVSAPHCKAIISSVSIPDAIIDYAEKENASLIIIGSKGLSSSSRFKMGSVASKVVKHSPCSVYVVKL